MPNEIQRLDCSGVSGDGDFLVNYSVPGDANHFHVFVNSGAVTYDDVYSNGINDAASDASSWQVTDNLDGTFDIEFINAYANTNIAEMTVSDYTASGTTPSVTTIQEGGASGPAAAVLFHNHYQQQGMQ